PNMTDQVVQRVQLGEEASPGIRGRQDLLADDIGLRGSQVVHQLGRGVAPDLAFGGYRSVGRDHIYSRGAAPIEGRFREAPGRLLDRDFPHWPFGAEKPTTTPEAVEAWRAGIHSPPPYRFVDLELPEIKAQRVRGEAVGVLAPARKVHEQHRVPP